MKTVKVNHAVLTLKIAPAGAGMSRDEVDELVNKRLAEGYDSVDVYPVKTNFSERNEPLDLTQLYIFKKYEEATAGEIAQAILDAPVSRGPGRPRKEKEPEVA